MNENFEPIEFKTKSARKSSNSSDQWTKIPSCTARKIVIAVTHFDMASRLFRQDKRKSGNTETTKKNIRQSKLSNHKLRVVDVFEKRMSLVDVAIAATVEVYHIEALVAGKDCHQG